MSKKARFMSRIVTIVLLILCFQGCFSFNPTSFVRAEKLEIQDVPIYQGIEIDALLTVNTTNTGNWTWAVDQPWCSNDTGVYTIEDMIINNTAGTPRGSGIFINNSHDVDFRIENCTITNVNAIISYGAGIDLENSSRGVIINNTVSNTNPIGCGIQLRDYNCYNITIERNVVKNILRHGILMYGGDEIHVINNTVNNVAYNGIYFYQGVQNSTIAYNYVNDTNNNQMSSTNGGIKLLDVNNDNNQIYNNTVLNCWRGIYLRDSSNNSIHNNTVKNNDDGGIILSTNSDDNNVTNNIVTNENGDYEQDYGIWLASSHNNTISDNHISNQQQHGIFFQTSLNNTIIGNTVNVNKFMGIFLTDSANGNSIKDNSIDRNDLGIGLSYSEFNNITDNTLFGNGYCIYEVECGTNFITNNNCSEAWVTTPINIDDGATGIGAHNWTWAENQSWCSGAGTESDPYIIENLVISALGFSSYGIHIENSNVSFIIRNCSIYNCDTGIYVQDSNNSQIIGNEIFDCEEGINFDYSSENTISGNNVSNTDTGITLYAECFNNTISDNTLSNNPYGIYVYEYCDNNVITDNTVNQSEVGIDVDYYCDNNTISQNILSEVVYGIYVYDYCSNFTIVDNTISHSDVGLELYGDCMNNSISGNVILNCDEGIFVDDDSNYNVFTLNVLRNCTTGMIITDDSSNNSIYHNFFVDNEYHAEDWGTDNNWNSSTIGNYWTNWTSPDNNSDGIVDTPYTFIGGSAGSNDSLPIAEDGAPRITINFPTGGRFSDAPPFDVVVTDIYVYEMWYTLDGGITNYTFTENGVIDQAAWDALPRGKVTIRFYARDVAGNVDFKDVTITKYSQTLRIVGWIVIGVVAALGASGYFLIKFWKIKLEE
ncbi:MAG: right-handed parallel beta-helix repeat-containing protein [Promethearchaeota archaeon]